MLKNIVLVATFSLLAIPYAIPLTAAMVCCAVMYSARGIAWVIRGARSN